MNPVTYSVPNSSVTNLPMLLNGDIMFATTWFGTSAKLKMTNQVVDKGTKPVKSRHLRYQDRDPTKAPYQRKSRVKTKSSVTKKLVRVKYCALASKIRLVASVCNSWIRIAWNLFVCLFNSGSVYRAARRKQRWKRYGSIRRKLQEHAMIVHISDCNCCTTFIVLRTIM